ncbi:MAG: phosphoribosylglycinamide formyltransferase [Clostridia bacterium]|nr:phosphoribosylglycinamide formyltransferase [Clostridia bacterium]
MNKAKIAVLVSGGGTNLQALLDAQGDVITSGEITLVISNKAGAYALERAAKAGVKGETVLKRECGSQEAFEDKVLSLLRENDIDMIVLAGFLSVLSERFVREYPNRIINIHPSLIPKHCGDGFYGLKVHESVLAAGDKVTGATVHYVNEVTDGGEIIFQKEVPVMDGDTPEVLQKRVMEQAEWILLPRACEMVSKKIVEESK